jgi:hypothetical protein
MTGLIIAAVYVAFTVVMVLALTYSGRGEATGPIGAQVWDRCAERSAADPFWSTVDAMPDVTATFAHILAEHSERTET